MPKYSESQAGSSKKGQTPEQSKTGMGNKPGMNQPSAGSKESSKQGSQTWSKEKPMTHEKNK